MTIATRRLLLIPYNESLQSDFLMLNCCSKNRAEMNGPLTVTAAKQLFHQVMHDSSLYSMAVLDQTTREFIGHVFVCHLDKKPELGFIFDKAYWGRGIASEALKAFFPKALYECQLETVSATVNVNHQASIRILHKLGFMNSAQRSDSFGPFYEYVFRADAAINETRQA
ncbi:GNAT family N-acetyltransferase [Vibrio sp. AK197]